ncbi:MAG: DNA translocase FtsK 4TM domain-containing protein, partial [Nitrospirota bacterium]
MANRRVGKTRDGGLRRELAGIAFTGLGLIFALALFSYSPLDKSLGSVSSSKITHNLIGRFGSYSSDILFQLLGGGAFLIPFYMLVHGINLFAQKETTHRFLKTLGAALFIVSLSSLLRLRYEYLYFGGIRAGGWIGEATAARMLVFFGRAGSYILTITLLLCGAVVSTTLSLLTIILAAKAHLLSLWGRVGMVYMMHSERKRKAKVKEVRDEVTSEPPPQIVEQVKKPAPPPAAERLQEALPFKGADKDYSLPPMSLLSDPPANRKRVDKESLLMSSSILEKKLHDFDVEGRVIQVHPGPVITMYEFEPAPGVKVNRIATLSDDLALAMRAESVRIVAPLPGKAAVGIEIPNNVREEVYLKEILSSAEFMKAKSPLTLALGKDIYGMPVVSDLSKMPHLLVAGATGSGKSVAINTMTMSLLMSAKPRDLRLLMVDPKRLELSVYDGIPHLLEPVITEPRRASASLRRVVVVMEERYKLLAEKGVRNIEGYNQNIIGEKKHPRLGVDKSEDAPKKDAVINDDGTLPYVVVVIDELADLMMVAAKEVEDSIARLAQMARASGIHLLMATQRPS